MYQESVILGMEPESRPFNRSCHLYSKRDSCFAVCLGMTRNGCISNRHPETLRAAILGFGKKGFTLIELLVVVLIIGILASVALPQYQVAVAKTRVASYLPFLRTLQKAQEQYYMANGAYAASIRDLDVECQSYGSGAHENWCYLDKKGKTHILLSDRAFVLETSGVKATIYFFYRGSSSCYAVADNNLATRVCQSLTGDKNPGGFDNTKIYRFQNIS